MNFLFYVIDKTWAADLYLIYKLEPKANVCISDKDRMRVELIISSYAFLSKWLPTRKRLWLIWSIFLSPFLLTVFRKLPIDKVSCNYHFLKLSSDKGRYFCDIFDVWPLLRGGYFLSFTNLLLKMFSVYFNYTKDQVVFFNV